MIISTILNKIKGIFTKTKDAINTLKTKSITFISTNKSTIQGFIKLVSVLYEKYDGKEKMKIVIKMVTASVAGTEYTDEQAEELAKEIEENVQKVYDEMKAKGLV